MRDVSLWSALLGVEKSVIESIEFVADSGVVVAHVRPKRGHGAVAVAAVAAVVGTTPAAGGDVDGPWAWAR